MDANLTFLEVVQKSILIKIALVFGDLSSEFKLVFILHIFVEFKESQVRLHIHITLRHGWSHGCKLDSPGSCSKIYFNKDCTRFRKFK